MKVKAIESESSGKDSRTLKNILMFLSENKERKLTKRSKS